MKILESYKKIAKSMLIEHAWDRKFGEPLPTLEDVMREAEEVDPDKVIGKNDKDKDITVQQAMDYSGDNETMNTLKKKAQDLKSNGGEEEPKSKGLGKGDFERDFDDEEPKGGEEKGDIDPEFDLYRKAAAQGMTPDQYTSMYGGTGDKPRGEPEGDEEPEGDDDPSSSDYDSKKAWADFKKDAEYMIGRDRGGGKRAISSYTSDLNFGPGSRRKAIKRREEWDKKKELRGQRATAIASGEVAPNSPEDANMALDHSQQEIYRAKRSRDREALKKAKSQQKAAKKAIKQQAKKQGWKTSFGTGRVKTENANSVIINGKNYRPIKESVEPTIFDPKKHPLRETYERIGGK